MHSNKVAERTVTQILMTLLLMLLAQFASAQTNTFPSSGNVGVGTTSPSVPLEVRGGAVMSRVTMTGTTGANGKFQIWSADIANNPFGEMQLFAPTGAGSEYLRFNFGNSNGTILPDILTINRLGNVGIGTANPGQRLNVVGNSLFGNIASRTQLYSTYDAQQNPFLEIGYDTSHSAITPLPFLVLSNNTTSTNNGEGVIGQIAFANRSIADGNDKRTASIISWVDGASNSGTLQFYTTSAGTLGERLRITSAGNVGIGTTDPSLGGAVASRFTVTQADASTGFTVANTSGVPRFALNGNSNGSWTLWDYGAGSAWTAGITQKTGNVGIGSTNPSYKLDVAGQVRSSSGGFVFPDGTVQTTAASGSGGSSQWSGASGNPIYYNAANVGIGTASPSTRLHVSAGDSSFALFGPNTTWGGSLAVGSGASFLTPISGRAQVLSSNGNLHLDAGTNQYVYIGWLNASNTIINGQGGNVGIGNNAPAEKLHVTGNGKFTGNLTVDGNIAAKYQDVAEWVLSSEQLAAGTVVVLDSNKSNHVVSSNQAYDTSVAGVITEQPGIALGERSAEKVLVATTGRVRVKVDATRAPIRIGDLIVTSDISGVGMKSEPVNLGGVKIHRPGTIVGKALEPLASGSGSILVLLSLQ
jgi:hypothetical protein